MERLTQMEVQLGQRVKDKITGLKGIAISRSTYLYGCVRIAVQPDKLQAGKMADPIWIDEPQLEVIGEGIAEAATPESYRHGPREDAQRSQDATR
jgi:hypothetical protein